jgi:DNA mismatch repair protein MutL
VAINGVPADAPNQAGNEVFKAILEDYKNHRHEYREKKAEYLARAFARYACIGSEKRLALEEMMSLIDRLFACKNPNHSPDGRLIYYIMKFDEINHLFNK